MVLQAVCATLRSTAAPHSTPLSPTINTASPVFHRCNYKNPRQTANFSVGQIPVPHPHRPHFSPPRPMHTTLPTSFPIPSVPHSTCAFPVLSLQRRRLYSAPPHRVSAVHGPGWGKVENGGHQGAQWVKVGRRGLRPLPRPQNGIKNPGPSPEVMGPGEKSRSGN